MENLIAFVAILSLLVFVHELGHFVTAKRAGVKVLEFGFGYPPRVFAIRRGETEYSLNLLPLGGFVKMLGEEDPGEQGSLASKGVGTRLIVLAAGATMNALLAVVLFTASYAVPKDVPVGQVAVMKVAPSSPAERAGLQAGDIILRVNDRPIQNTLDLGYNINLNLGSPIELLVQRDRNERKVIRVTPRWNPPSGEGATGIEIGMANRYVVNQAYPLWEAVPLGLRKTADMLTITKNEFMGMAIRRMFPQVAGPIGIYQMTGEVARVGLGYLVEFAALLSVNLAVVNMLPIPFLDGGRIVFVMLEGLRGGKRIPPEKESLVHLAGLVFLITLIVVVSYYDVLRIMNAENTFR